MALAKLRGGKHPAQAIKQAGYPKNEDPCAFDGNAGVGLSLDLFCPQS